MITNLFTELSKLLPMFELVVTSGGWTETYFIDKEIYNETIYIEINKGVYRVFPSKYAQIDSKFMFILDYDMASKSGVLLVSQDIILSDEICLKFYTHNVDVQSVRKGNGCTLYDRQRIERQATFKDLLND